MFTVEKWNPKTLQKIEEKDQQTIGQVLLHIARMRSGEYMLRIFSEHGTKILVDQFEEIFVEKGKFYWATNKPIDCVAYLKKENWHVGLCGTYFMIWDAQTQLVLGIGDLEACSQFLDYANAE